MKSFRVQVLAMSLVAALAGCASSPPPTLLALPSAMGGFSGLAGNPTASASNSGTASAPGPRPADAPVLVVRRLDLPEYLVARRVRYRADASTIGEWPNTYWAERFEVGMTREFTDAVRAALPGWVVCEATCTDRAPVLSLQVELVPLDFWRAQKRLVARARFTLSGASSNAAPGITSEQAYEFAVAEDTPQAYALALAELLKATARAAAPLVSQASGR
jgi:uncharacterized lipoprotein YmbA